MSSSTSFTQALYLLIVILVVTLAAHVGTPSAAADVHSNNLKKKSNQPLPGSCLMAASTLCANADTNAMRCLRKLATKGDARVPPACAEALMAGVTVNHRLKQHTRGTRLSRLLLEAGSCSANTCSNTLGGIVDNQCNDVLSQCLLLRVQCTVHIAG